MRFENPACVIEMTNMRYEIDSPTLLSQKIFLIFKIVSVIISFIIIITIVITDNRDHIKRWQKILFANVANQ